MESIKMVEEFHKSFSHPIGETANIPPDSTNQFRYGFIREELDEVMKACEERDIIELADGLGDIQYVLDGWFLNAGLHDKKEAILTEIHRSNMSKLCKDDHEAEVTINTLTIQFPGVEFTKETIGDYITVKRADNGKVMKSVNYFKPNLKLIISPSLF